jgi:Na+/melibiose symporter-like transporter
MWQVPPTSLISLETRWLYYLLTTLALSLGYTVIAIPYAAATPELAHSYNDRTALTSARFAGGLLGGVASVFTFGQLQLLYVDNDTRPLDVEEDYRKGYALAATVTTPIIFLGPLVCGLVIREYLFESSLLDGLVGVTTKSAMEILRGWWSLLKNRAYVLLLLTYCLAWYVFSRPARVVAGNPALFR